VTAGWSPAADERADLFRRAIEQDELAVVKGLIDLGADPNGAYFGTNTPPLMMVRSAPVARLLIDAGANPNAVNDHGGTPLGWSVYFAPDVGRLLLKAGASRRWSIAPSSCWSRQSQEKNAGSNLAVEYRREWF
jgi:ankyrin repeat protein